MPITKVVFNSTISTDHFNVTLSNSETSGAYVDISEISLQVNGEIVDIIEWAAYPEQRVEPRYSVLLVCTLNWQNFKGKTATVTIVTLQGFQVSLEEITVPN